jgi:hypothetical protein
MGKVFLSVFNDYKGISNIMGDLIGSHIAVLVLPKKYLFILCSV